MVNVKKEDADKLGEIMDTLLGECGYEYTMVIGVKDGVLAVASNLGIPEERRSLALAATPLEGDVLQ